LPGALTASGWNVTREVLSEVIEVNSDFAAMTGARWKSATRPRRLATSSTPRPAPLAVHDGFVFLAIAATAWSSRWQARAGRRAGSGLGIMRNEARSRYANPVTLDSMDPDHRTLLFEGAPLNRRQGAR